MNQKISVDVIIPTYKPGAAYRQLLEMLGRQTVPIRCIRVMNTGKENWRAEFEAEHLPMEVMHVTQEAFDHGGTRDQAARMSDAEYLLFMTQDAVPDNEYLVEELLKTFSQDPQVKAAYARQLPNPDCRLAEKYTRTFNYPPESRVKSKADLPVLGIKTFFCSNVCAMYERETYLALGGFVKHTIFNEDMIYAGNLIQKDWKIAYAAEARVRHSHNYTAMQQFHRNFDLAVSQADHPEVFAGIRSEGEGIRLVRSTAAWLCRKKKPWLVISLIWNSGWKYLGYLAGKNYRRLPSWLILRWTMNPGYWKEEKRSHF